MGIETFGFDAAAALLNRYGPKEMQDKIKAGEAKAGKALVPLIRRSIDESIKGHGHKPGTLRARVSVRKPYQLGGAVVRVASYAPHNHLVIRGHRLVTHAGVDTGKRSREVPFIDKVRVEGELLASEVMREEVFK